jgi:hypothetical protein
MGIIILRYYLSLKKICPSVKVLYFIFFPLLLQAQKDLNLTQLLPESNQKIVRYQPFIFKAKIENAGAITVPTKNIMEVSIQLFGNIVYSAIIPHPNLAPGDSLFFTDEIAFNFSAEYHGEQFCSSVTLINNVDPTPNDQSDCKMVDLLLYPTATGDIGEETENLSIYPNPSNGNFTISQTLSNYQKQDINIFDEFGRSIYAKKGISKTEHIDLTNLTKGFYYISISDNNSLITKKIIIE